LRLRYETIDQSNKTKTAEATTLRARLGYQTGSYFGFSALAEADFVQHFGPEHFNNTINGLTQYPAIPDPDMASLNRLQLAYATHVAADADAMPNFKLIVAVNAYSSAISVSSAMPAGASTSKPMTRSRQPKRR
jgi:hypothetical protein